MGTECKQGAGCNSRKNYAEIQKSVFYPDKSILEIEKHFELKSDSGDPIIHIFNFKNGGFVLVSGDMRSVPVLAYSFEAGFDVNNMAPATADWLNHYIAQVEDIQSKLL